MAGRPGSRGQPARKTGRNCRHAGCYGTDTTEHMMEGETNGRVEAPLERHLRALHRRYTDDRRGEVATYIPALAAANPEWFGICLVTTDGHVYEVGDTRQSFTIQSISKPFTYGLAIEDHGLGTVLGKIGVEPSGEAFNSISLAPETGRPRNPMINAGAIVASSLIRGTSPAHRLE